MGLNLIRRMMSRKTMKIKETLLKDRSKETCAEIVAYIGTDKGKLSEFMEAMLSSDYELSQKASWVLQFITDSRPELLDLYQQDLLEKIKQEGNHDAVLRAIMRHWGEYGFPESIEGEVYDLGFKYLEGNYAIAIKAHAMSACLRLVKKYPELATEFYLLMQEVVLKYGESSAGIKSRGIKIIKELEKFKGNL